MASETACTVGALALLFLAACVAVPEPPSERAGPSAKVEGRELDLSESESFEARLARTPDAERAELVRRFPEGALRLVRAEAGSPRAEEITLLHAALFGGDPTWCAAYETARAAVLEAASPAGGRQALAEVLERTDGLDSHRAFEGGLLLARVCARAEDAPGAAAAWRGALVHGASVADPQLWQEAIDARPAGASWPGAPAPASECAALSALARMHLARGEAESALLAAVRARSSAVDPTERAEGSLQVARADHALGRSGEALVALEGALPSEVPSIRGPAWALSGVLAVEREDMESARYCFEIAVEQADWSGRGRAASDLGSVLALLGDSQAALAMLERAAVLCRAESDPVGLARVCENQAAIQRLAADPLAQPR